MHQVRIFLASKAGFSVLKCKVFRLFLNEVVGIEARKEVPQRANSDKVRGPKSISFSWMKFEVEARAAFSSSFHPFQTTNQDSDLLITNAWLQIELGDIKSRYYLIIIITISKKQKHLIWKIALIYDKGSQVGAVVIIRASHLYDPGSNPVLRTWAEICQSQSGSEGFSPGTPVFLPRQNRLPANYNWL